MAKQVYKIPLDLNQQFSDMEIAIQNSNGMGAKPLPIKVILTYVASILLLFYLCSQTFLSASVGYWLPFAIVWLALTFVLARYDKTKRMQLQSIPALFGYLSKSARHVITRRNNRANDFISICGIDDIDKKTAVIKFTDGTYGLLYRVVGSASILLFDEDRDAIISRVDSFYRKIGIDCEISFITTKEAQKVYRQVANLKRRYDAMDTDDADLKNLAEEQFYVLKYDIGNAFRSIHQYMLLKSDNKESLIKNRNVLQSEVENSTLMFKQCVALDFTDVCKVFKSIYA